MLKTIYLLFFLLGVSLSAVQGERLPEDDQQDPNAFVDSIFETALNKIHRQGAIPIPGEHDFGPFGLFTIEDAHLLDVGNISRNGDASIQGVEDSGIIYVNTSFTISNVRANSSFLVNLPVKGTVRVNATSTIKRIDLTVRCEYDPIKGVLKPTAVHVDSFSGVETLVTGLGPFNPIVEKMVTVSADVLEKIIAKIINLTLDDKLSGHVFQIPKLY